MNSILHQADSRGLADHGWLLSRHTFSFADYHDPERMGFGLLRVINDDIVQPAMGFGTHPHANMEIVSIPLSGALLHEDSMGNRHTIRADEVQVISAGRGLTHSEYNASEREEVNFLQIWVLPKEKNIPPRYEQKRFDPGERRNRFQTLVAPDKESGALWINQDVWFSLAELDAGQTLSYHLQRKENGVYFFVIEGAVEIEGIQIARRDGLALTEVGEMSIRAHGHTVLLCIDVPLTN